MSTHHDILLPDLLQRAAEAHPNRLALRSPAWRLSFGDVHARTNALGHALVERGVRRGDAVVILGRGSVQTILELWSVLKANAVAILLPAGTPPDRVIAELETHRARVLVSEARLLAELTALAVAGTGLEHAIVCGAVEPEELPPLPGAVSAVRAMAGQVRRVPPVPEALPTDPAFVTHDLPGGAVHTHRAVLERLPRAAAGAQEIHEPGLAHSAPGVDLVIRTCRDGVRLSLSPPAEREPRQSFANLQRTP